MAKEKQINNNEKKIINSKQNDEKDNTDINKNTSEKQKITNEKKTMTKKRKPRKLRKRKQFKEDSLIKFYLGEKYIPSRWGNDVRLHRSQFLYKGFLK